MGHHVFKELQSKDKPCKNFNSYFIEEDHFFDYKESIEISKLWFINSKGDDATIYNGVSIGVILQRFITHLFNNLLSNIRTVQRIFNEEKPDEIWLASENEKNIIKQPMT